ncbi:hypothetical protein DUI87_35423 [Hirundo rustica rustica]|uniref:Uncharacterized protein n=1 Tax=Hirundo rustica rustica TaxID=333673 RepID=A0A3M0IJA2_HIRRU|nr:hypothetical protein DUI87_35423 [Hirundo rustica rustica]
MEEGPTIGFWPGDGGDGIPERLRSWKWDPGGDEILDEIPVEMSSQWRWPLDVVVHEGSRWPLDVVVHEGSRWPLDVVAQGVLQEVQVAGNGGPGGPGEVQVGPGGPGDLDMVAQEGSMWPLDMAAHEVFRWPRGSYKGSRWPEMVARESPGDLDMVAQEVQEGSR